MPTDTRHFDRLIPTPSFLTSPHLALHMNCAGIARPATGKPRNKLGKLEALRQAQLTILRHYDPVRGKLRGLDLLDEPANAPQHGSPFYWAAFVLSGDWR